MRLRNIKNAHSILENSKYFLKNPENYKNKFQELFNNENKIMLEVGMGKGDFLIAMAEKNPNINFVGVEKYESILVRTLQKLEKKNLPNILVICSDASKLGEIFDKEIDTLYLNFSDPWPKKRHYKRRLTYRDYLSIYDKCFKNEAHIIQKTDNDGLFESSIVELSNFGYIFDDVCLDLWNSTKDNIKTEYENKFGNKGYKIKYLDAHKRIGKN